MIVGMISVRFIMKGYIQLSPSCAVSAQNESSWIILKRSQESIETLRCFSSEVTSRNAWWICSFNLSFDSIFSFHFTHDAQMFRLQRHQVHMVKSIKFDAQWIDASRSLPFDEMQLIEQADIDIFDSDFFFLLESVTLAWFGSHSIYFGRNSSKLKKSLEIYHFFFAGFLSGFFKAKIAKLLESMLFIVFSSSSARCRLYLCMCKNLMHKARKHALNEQRAKLRTRHAIEHRNCYARAPPVDVCRTKNNEQRNDATNVARSAEQPRAADTIWNWYSFSLWLASSAVAFSIYITQAL